VAVGSVSFVPNKCLQFFTWTDEVSALVVDIGSSSLRAGYAGDDTPKAIIPTSYGYKVAPAEGDIAMSGIEEGAESIPKPRHAEMYIGQNGPLIWRNSMEIGNPLLDGLSESEMHGYDSRVAHFTPNYGKSK